MGDFNKNASKVLVGRNAMRLRTCVTTLMEHDDFIPPVGEESYWPAPKPFCMTSVHSKDGIGVQTSA